MPGRDRTGPLGAGPRTGRGMGYCGGNDQGRFVDPARGLRNRFGFGFRGAGHGWRHRFFATGMPGWLSLTPEQETADLKVQADLLKTQLDAIQEHIEELTAK